MSQDFQAHFAALAPGGSSADEGVEAALEHRDYGFYLDPIAIGREVEALLHQPSIAAPRWLVRRPTAFGADDRADSAFAPREGVVRFRIKACVGRDPADP